MIKKEVGVVKWFNNIRGYGFITRENGDYLFMHIKSIFTDGFNFPKKSDRVEFDIFVTEKGEVARNIKVL